jgi:hypothetical protein
MRHLLKDRQLRQCLTDALGVLSLFVLFAVALHLPLPA